MEQVKSNPDLPLFDDASIEPYAVKQMGNFLFQTELDENSYPAGYVSPGHNSVYYDEESGKYQLFFHTRFPDRGEFHQVRVHQMFMNSEGWPVIAPHRYTGETTGNVSDQDVSGNYRFINHGKQISAELNESIEISLEPDQKITGAAEGKWKRTGDHLAELEINGDVYKGVFLEQWMKRQGKALWCLRLSPRLEFPFGEVK